MLALRQRRGRRGTLRRFPVEFEIMVWSNDQIGNRRWVG
jgi:hypothetical protein